jgi:diguanylate cyclase (GGDEF)-like protein
VTQPRNVPFEARDGRHVNMLGQKAMSVPPAIDDESSPVVERYTKEQLAKNGNRMSRKRYIASTLHLPERNWWLVCEDEESMVVAPVVTRKNKIVLANLLICGLFVLLAWKMTQTLLRPLTALMQGAARINAGEPNVEIPGEDIDEIGKVKKAFNQMARRITATEEQLQRKNMELERRNEELTTVNDKLEELSMTDGLTGLFNHRHFWNLVNTELSRANLYQGELGLVLLDIDNFKQVNDQFGHATGDELIRRIATVLKSTVRETDLAARYGGEEFAVLLPDTSRKGVMRVSEKIRHAVEKMVFKIPETDITVSITVSIGVSVYRGDRREFFNAADRALYQSKSQGKNRVNFEVAKSMEESSGEEKPVPEL